MGQCSRRKPRLVGQCSRFFTTPVGSLRPLTYSTLFGLLYCTGLRISEALALRLADVDFDANMLLVRESKFHKSRLLPLGIGISDALRRYQEERAKRAYPRDPDAPFFVNERRGACAYPAVCAIFLLIARRVGVRTATAKERAMNVIQLYEQTPVARHSEIVISGDRLYFDNLEYIMNLYGELKLVRSDQELEQRLAPILFT